MTAVHKNSSRVDTLCKNLPGSPGVYLFYGMHDELLYVGKSRSIRTRVRSHFASREERTMCRQVARVEARETPGELGALLLESDLIKSLRPIFNMRSRQRRRMIVAKRGRSREGYTTVSIDAVENPDPAMAQSFLGLFRTRMQAKEFFAMTVRTHRLCPKLLGLERSSGSCFSYHLGRCSGACIGSEEAEVYNARVEEAFAERRIKAWPFPGAILIEEKSALRNEAEVFIVDNWCLLYSFVYATDHHKLSIRGSHRFDYDSYKLLASYIFDPSHRDTLRGVSSEEIRNLLQTLAA